MPAVFARDAEGGCGLSLPGAGPGAGCRGSLAPRFQRQHRGENQRPVRPRALALGAAVRGGVARMPGRGASES